MAATNRLSLPYRILIAVCCCVSAGLAVESQFYPDNVFSRGPLDYGPVLVDSKSTSLYVGARGHLFKLWLFNINQTNSANLFLERKLETRPEDEADCLAENAPAECQTAVRSIFLTSENHLITCVASGMKPQLLRIHAHKLTDESRPRTVIGICAPQAGLNTTAIYVEEGNPDGIPSFYSGIRTGLTLENYLIYRPPLEFNNRQVHGALSTIYTDSKWLDEPQFVGSFSHENYVYFFFREVATEAESCGKVMYSRVARVCKRDLGGNTVGSAKWSSFVKARLNCSLATGAYPFYFDHIQSIEKVSTGSDTLFYSTFSTSESPFMSSALCVFSLNTINRVFDNGLFLEHSNNAWAPTLPDTIPKYRPGSCVPDSRSLSDSELHFAQSHLLMADTIPGGEPLYHAPGAPLGKIVADVRDEDTIVLYALIPHERRLLKLLHNRQESDPAAITKLLANYKLPFPEPVNTIAILPNDYLFVADSARVSQYRLAQCGLHADCSTCATDPHCSWNIARAECFAQETVHTTAVGWITNSKSAERCAAYVKSISKTLYPGDAIHLDCPTGAAGVQWLVDKELVEEDTEHVKLTKNGGLVILNATGSESGTYQCTINKSPVVDYLVRVDEEECTRPATIEQFQSIQREWCRKFDAYKHNMQKWQRWYDNNSQCSRIPDELNRSRHKQAAIL
uniref:Sema domain-containing protein n=1 Tax=Panagrellus redivivus TaxID=6233 RepID=A0A7E4VNZ1_PANRE